MPLGKTMPEVNEDSRILGYDPLLSPQFLQIEVRAVSHTIYWGVVLGSTDTFSAQPSHAIETVRSGRNQAIEVIEQRDDRLLVVVGPCSIHDPDTALEYARRLKAISEKLKDDLCIIMRAYLEKPRTTVGWKGLINDPDIDGSFTSTRASACPLYADLNGMGIPIASEMLDTISPQYLADVSRWVLSAPVPRSQLIVTGFRPEVLHRYKTHRCTWDPIDAIGAAAHPHHFLGVTKQGLAAITKTSGTNTHRRLLARNSERKDSARSSWSTALTETRKRII
ncbi:LOW QUALITY PROTEIN: phospho-2-dehydro-3-deoxyheptonate aldolase [Coccidioides immitis RMSCC 3703]|uniref:3-deoxy-7-phosphoheptulonate synthase n=1 Tax=Coccidioides immitis RMSCC 3703 TaxID=454286 RepID=A0A0J8QXN3_COCIT|nr:LOW QUALITY PROTEIN: phospho-2-dehydro-3-deoxyheptonate aldolase [Coccidioides immitis RMSCC 3703]